MQAVFASVYIMVMVFAPPAWLAVLVRYLFWVRRRPPEPMRTTHCGARSLVLGVSSLAIVLILAALRHDPFIVRALLSPGGANAITVIDSDGANRVDVAVSTSTLSHPVFSPDSRTLGFVRAPIASSSGRVCVIDLRDAGQRLSPGAAKLAESSEAVEIEAVHHLEWTGASPVVVARPTPPVYDAVLSPDGRKMVHYGERHNRLLCSNLDGTGQVDLSGVPVSNSEISDGDPSWSPDGTRIAFLRYDWAEIHNSGYDVCLVRPDGTGMVNLMHTPANQPHKEATSVGDSAPAWSPDGSRIAFGSSQTRSLGSGIFVMNTDGSGLTNLMPGEGEGSGSFVSPCGEFLSWSPDGGKIAFTGRRIVYGPRGRQDRWSLFVVSSRGGRAMALADVEFEHELVWSPDGNKLAFEYEHSRFGGVLAGVLACLVLAPLAICYGVRSLRSEPDRRPAQIGMLAAAIPMLGAVLFYVMFLLFGLAMSVGGAV